MTFDIWYGQNCWAEGILEAVRTATLINRLWIETYFPQTKIWGTVLHWVNSTSPFTVNSAFPPCSLRFYKYHIERKKGHIQGKNIIEWDANAQILGCKLMSYLFNIRYSILLQLVFCSDAIGAVILRVHHNGIFVHLYMDNFGNRHAPDYPGFQLQTIIFGSTTSIKLPGYCYVIIT